MQKGAWVWVAGLAVAACLGWLPFLDRSLSADEGGYLIVAEQWSSGSSLYGDYWVDRPPVLIAIFALADVLGGTIPLRLLGTLAVVATVVLAALLGRASAPGSARAPLVTAATAAILCATPLFGGSVVNGELLALPFVLAGMATLVTAHTAQRLPEILMWGLAAGACAAVAVLVKQNVVDVFVMAVALLASRSRSVRALAAMSAGAVVTTAAVVAAAATLGTDTSELWDALVTFRFEAAEVLAASAGEAARGRLGSLLLALLFSGLPLVVAVLAWRGRARTVLEGRPGSPPDLRWPAYAVLGWELVVVALGGSYWLHYLMGLVPGVVLLAAAAAQRAPTAPRVVAAAYVFAALSTLGVIGWLGLHPIDRPEDAVVDYLADTASPGDTAVVVLGAANALREPGLDSPYPYLWSLPARVRDPDLHDLNAVLAGPQRPTWLVIRHPALEPWGLDFTEAQQQVDAHYTEVTVQDAFTVYLRDDDA